MQLRRFILICAVSLLAVVALADDWQKIPVVEITTVDGELPTFTIIKAPYGCAGESIANNDYVRGRMVITQDGDTLYDSGEWVEGVSGMRLKVRGNTSAQHPFPGYKVKLSKKHDLMGFGVSNKTWALLGVHMVLDQRYALLNNLVGREISTLAGMEWQPRYKFVEFYLNGDYRGLYQIADVVERADGRCDIGKTGFIIENDSYWWKEQDSGLYFKVHHQRPSLGFTFKYPDDELLTDSVVAQTKDIMTEFVDSLYSGGDVSQCLDLRSAASWVLAHDILGIYDVAGSNMYFSKKNVKADDLWKSKLKMGPLWDFDSVCLVEGSFSRHHVQNNMFFNELFNVEDFYKEYKCLWDSIQPLVIPRVCAVADSLARLFGPNLDQVVERSAARRYEAMNGLEASADALVDYMKNRVAWLTANITSMRLPVVFARTDGLDLYTIQGHFMGHFRNRQELLRIVRDHGLYIYIDAETKTRGVINL